MKKSHASFDKDHALHQLKHYLPTQAPLKDFIHHNTLHAFQDKFFHTGLAEAAQIFGYKVYLSLEEYQALYADGKISDEVLNKIVETQENDGPRITKDQLLHSRSEDSLIPRIGRLRSTWKTQFRIDLDSLVHPTLFRIIGSYLDQGVAIWNFPHNDEGLLSSMRELEKNSLTSFFRTNKVRTLLISGEFTTESLLQTIVGDESLFEQYLMDQQCAHPGWSGIVSVIDDNPGALTDARKISLDEFIQLELLMEIDALDDHFGPIWAPLASRLVERPVPLFADVIPSETQRLQRLWQDAYEWTFYNNVLSGVKVSRVETEKPSNSFQSIFCIDDRECSLRRYVEEEDPNCGTYGTAGFFGVEFFYQPEHGKFYTKVCPAPVTPKHLIRELESSKSRKKDFHFGKHSHGLVLGWIITHTLGFWSVVKLFLSVFKPAKSESSVSSFNHMDEFSTLTIENTNGEMSPEGLQIGYTLTEMTDRLENLLRSIGLIDHFAPLIYAVGHGSSSVNNTHYAGYDCGACSGRPGSVNARVICHIGNHPMVRSMLRERGIDIPASTQFVGALHDTSRDEISFYDVDVLQEKNRALHAENQAHFNNALTKNARERSRRFMSINTRKSAWKVHREVKQRTVSLFEPRPELNHATNTLCIVGRRSLTENLFLDRRSFLNSYDSTTDPEGKYLLGILNAVAPVCGGINLEYYFSRTDNQQLGAGTKLPHNVMGLIGVANGTDGDLRTGLPSQMIEVHDPLRLLVVVEHEPDVVLKTMKTNPATFEWFENEWVKICAIHPKTKQLSLYKKGSFEPLIYLGETPPVAQDLEEIIGKEHENIPVYLLKTV